MDTAHEVPQLPQNSLLSLQQLPTLAATGAVGVGELQSHVWNGVQKCRARLEILPDVSANSSFPSAVVHLIPRQMVLRQKSPFYFLPFVAVHHNPLLFLCLCSPESDARHKPGNKSSLLIYNLS